MSRAPVPKAWLLVSIEGLDVSAFEEDKQSECSAERVAA